MHTLNLTSLLLPFPFFFRDNTEQQGVRSVTTMCTSGQVGWHHPYGAVSIKFRLPQGQPFTLCFATEAIATTATVSLLHHGRKLDRLVTLAAVSRKGGGDGAGGEGDASARAGEVCVESARGEEVNLYMEAEMNQQSIIVGHVIVDYDVEEIDREKILRRQEDDMEGRQYFFG